MYSYYLLNPWNRVSRVCGRVIGYQFGLVKGFGSETIDEDYIDGVSLTHGPPRQHIWTFAAAQQKIVTNTDPVTSSSCPCINPSVPFPFELPSFVGNDYFCDSALLKQG